MLKLKGTMTSSCCAQLFISNTSLFPAHLKFAMRLRGITNLLCLGTESEHEAQKFTTFFGFA
jgi:hypothetical protein